MQVGERLPNAAGNRQPDLREKLSFSRYIMGRERAAYKSQSHAGAVLATLKPPP